MLRHLTLRFRHQQLLILNIRTHHSVKAEPNPTPTFLNGGVAGTFSEATGNVNFNDVSTGEINLSASTPGTYTITNTLDAIGGCPSISLDFDIVITAPLTANFSYTGQPYCIDGAESIGNLGEWCNCRDIYFRKCQFDNFDAATGEVDMSNSQPGTYTVTNTVAANGGCPAVNETASIIISDTLNGEFSYPGTPYCQTSGTAPAAIQPGSVAGTFSSDPNVVINSSTGQVNLSASTPGTYWVYNTVNPIMVVRMDWILLKLKSAHQMMLRSILTLSSVATKLDPIPFIPAGSSAGTLVPLLQDWYSFPQQLEKLT